MSDATADMAIDFHHHATTDAFCERVLAQTGKPAGAPGLPGIPSWDPQSVLRWMDTVGIERTILSPAARGFGLGGRKALVTFCAAAHVELLRLRERHPDRFGVLAPLPLPSLDDALDHIEAALRRDGVDGIAALTQYGGSYLGEPGWDDLLHLLDREGALVHVHPTAPALAPLTQHVRPNLVEYVFDTTRVALLFGKRRIFSRFPNIRWVFAHGGGTFPFVLDRFDNPEGTVDGGDSLESMLAVSYFDTALLGPPALAALASFAGPERTVFGSDAPFLHGDRRKRPFSVIEATFSGHRAVEAVKRGNILGLLDRSSVGQTQTEQKRD